MARHTPEELALMSDEDLAALSQDIYTEQQHRDDLARLPQSIDHLIQRFVDQGGDKTKIKNPQSYVKGPKGNTGKA